MTSMEDLKYLSFISLLSFVVLSVSVVFIDGMFFLGVEISNFVEVMLIIELEWVAVKSFIFCPYPCFFCQATSVPSCVGCCCCCCCKIRRPPGTTTLSSLTCNALRRGRVCNSGSGTVE